MYYIKYLIKIISYRFIASALTVLNDFDFDGLDIDWEFPVWNDYILEDKENFLSFLKVISVIHINY